MESKLCCVEIPDFGTTFNQNPRIISENQAYHTHTTNNRKQERSDIQ